MIFNIFVNKESCFEQVRNVSKDDPYTLQIIRRERSYNCYSLLCPQKCRTKCIVVKIACRKTVIVMLE